MSNYTKSTNFTSKDSLSSGNPLKIIKGSEFDTEFNAIATAVATKADSTSPTLVTPVLGTPASGTLTNCSGLPLSTGVTGTLPVANGGTGVTTSTGTGNTVLSAAPTLTGDATTTGTFKATGSSSMLGYSGSARTSVTQTAGLTITVDRPSFTLTTHNGTSYANGASFTFTVNNALVDTTSTIIITDSTAWSVSYSVWRVEAFSLASGSFKIRMTNVSGATTTAGMTMNITVLS
jgi:hypothetical protein